MFRIERWLTRLFRHGIITGVLCLICGLWAAAAVLAAVIGIGVMFFGALLPLLGRIAVRIFPAIVTSKGFALGVMIGLVWYFRNRRRNAAPAREKETAAASEKEEEAVIETKNYRFYA